MVDQMLEKDRVNVSSQGPGPVAKFFGVLMITVGLMIMLVAGSCTLALGLPYLGEGWEGIQMLLLLGGLPMLVGFLLFFIGRKLMGSRTPASG